jgi:hypothetical protein
MLLSEKDLAMRRRRNSPIQEHRVNVSRHRKKNGARRMEMSRAYARDAAIRGQLGGNELSWGMSSDGRCRRRLR